jgi:Uma2 family endonuclease
MSTVTRVSYDEFEAMIARGELDDEPRRQELLDGEIITMVVASPPHDETLDRFAEWSFANLPQDRVRIRMGGGVGLRVVDSLPIPDMTWLRKQDYSRSRPGPADVCLVVEVSFSSLSKDRNKKGRIYARAGLLEYWIVNLRGECIEVYREPGPTGFASRTLFFAGEHVRPLAFPELALPVSLILSEDQDDADGEEMP